MKYAGVAQLARASAFQAEGCEFESRHPLFLLGCRQAGKALGFEPSIRRFESYHPSLLLVFLMRGGEVVSRWAHNPEVAGSIPAPARVLPRWWNW